MLYLTILVFPILKNKDSQHLTVNFLVYYMLFKTMNSLLLNPHIQYIVLLTTNLFYMTFEKNRNLSPPFYRAQMQETKFFKLKMIHTPGKNIPVEDTLSCSFTKTKLPINQFKHNNFLLKLTFQYYKLIHHEMYVHYLIKFEEVLPHQNMILIQYWQHMIQF